MIGIIGAMPSEYLPLKEQMTEYKEEEYGSIKFTVGKLFGNDTVLSCSGVGKVFAAICAQTMILKYKVGLIINSGVAGTLTDRLTIGDVIVAKRFCQHDMDTTVAGDPKGLVSGINVIYFDSDNGASVKIMNIAEKMGIKCLSGTVASGDQFINDRDKKQEIIDTFDAMACEMEAAAIAQVCYVNRVPFAAMRAISDDAGGNGPSDYISFRNTMAKKSADLLCEFVKNYKEI